MFLIPGEAPALLVKVIRPQHELDHPQLLTSEVTKLSDASAGSPLPTGSSTHCAGVLGRKLGSVIDFIPFYYSQLFQSIYKLSGDLLRHLLMLHL